MSLDSSFNITLDSNDASFKILGDEKLMTFHLIFVKLMKNN